MIRNRQLALLAATLPITLGSFALGQAAQSDAPAAQAQQTGQAAQQAVRTGQQRAFLPVKASALLDAEVYNRQNEKLGSVNDIVLDGGRQRVSYIVLEHDKLVDLPDKLFALPWSTIQAGQAENERIVADIPLERLKSAPGFDRGSWPDFADSSLTGRIDTHYRSGANAAERAADNAGQAMNNAGQAVENAADRAEDALTGDRNSVDAARTAGAGAGREMSWIRQASKVIGADVTNAQDESLGNVRDLVIDRTSGQVHYAVIEHGGTLGVGGKMYAIPMSSISRDADDDDNLALNMSRSQLESMQGFDQDSWPDFADASVRQRLDQPVAGAGD